MLFTGERGVNAAGDGFDVRGRGGYNRGIREPDGPRFDEPRIVFGACAGAALYRRALFHDIGLFDEQFFLSWEDVDLDLRAALAGHRCLYVPTAVVHHAQGASSGEWRAALERRNKAILALKGLPLPLLALYLDAPARARGLRDARRPRGRRAATSAGSRPTQREAPARPPPPRRSPPPHRPARAVAAADARLAALRAVSALEALSGPRARARGCSRSRSAGPARRRRASRPACRSVRCTRWAATSPASTTGSSPPRRALDRRTQARERRRRQRQRTDAGRDQCRHARRDGVCVVERPLLQVDRRGAALRGAAPARTCAGARCRRTTTAATAPPPQAAPACAIGASRPISATRPAGCAASASSTAWGEAITMTLAPSARSSAEQARDARGDDGGPPARVGRVGVVAEQQQVLPGQKPLQGAGDRDPVAVLRQDAHGAVRRQTRGRVFSGS